MASSLSKMRSVRAACSVFPKRTEKNVENLFDSTSLRSRPYNRSPCEDQLCVVLISTTFRNQAKTEQRVLATATTHRLNFENSGKSGSK